MVTLEKAMAISKALTEYPDLLQVSETDALWLLSYGEKGIEVIPGELIIAVSKSTGKANFICLPSDEGFEIIADAKSTIEEPSFWKYLTFNDEGISGIRTDAPDKEKAAFHAWQQEQSELEKQGIKI